MTVTNTTAKSGPYTANDVTTVFNRTFRLLSASHIRVIQTVDGVAADVTTGFSQTGVGADSGSVVFTTPPPSGATITILRDVPVEQQSDYSSQASVDPAVIERDFDRVVMMIQDLQVTFSDQFGDTLARFLEHLPPAEYSRFVPAGSVSTLKLADGAVTGPKIARDGVTGYNIAGGAVTETKVAGGAVTETKVAGGAVTETKVADGAITRVKLAPAVLSGQDATLITGTSGADGNVASFNADGDLVDAGVTTLQARAGFTGVQGTILPRDLNDLVLDELGGYEMVRVTIVGEVTRTELPLYLEAANNRFSDPWRLIASFTGPDWSGSNFLFIVAEITNFNRARNHFSWLRPWKLTYGYAQGPFNRAQPNRAVTWPSPTTTNVKMGVTLYDEPWNHLRIRTTNSSQIFTGELTDHNRATSVHVEAY